MTCWDTAIGHAAEAQQGYEVIVTACETALAQASGNRDLFNYAREAKNQAAD